ncbi:Holliday junction resolvase RuvX [Meridianimarinicoccus sp. MJW13]|uniref:Holliday junction resolvase RuvX n=1 Tax=Meridianimarinicoccus sp. MJW13 TaxID=2720031 RepID=UPI0018692A6A|nr:Holliday junction resolvase RuvX [Fluviibacterium sp. MJW13]
MIHDGFEAFAAALPPNRAIICLDYGTKTIGLAMSDPRRKVASPVKTIRRKKFTKDVLEILTFCREREISGVLLGLPLNMDGSEGPRCQSTRAFARNLSEMTEMAIGYWDERLSTVAAERALLESDRSRGKRAAVIDNVAASFILQGALDRLSFMETSR